MWALMLTVLRMDDATYEEFCNEVVINPKNPVTIERNGRTDRKLAGFMGITDDIALTMFNESPILK